MQIVPTQPVPYQIIIVQLNGQNCQINVRQLFYGIFVDLLVNNVLLIGGVLAQDRNILVISPYLGFIGDLMFIDNEGTQDPYYTGLGARYSLAYLAPGEYPAGTE